MSKNISISYNNRSDSPTSLLIVTQYSQDVSINGSDNEKGIVAKILKGKEKQISGEFSILRYIGRVSNLAGNASDLFSISEVDQWVDFAVEINGGDLTSTFQTLNQHLNFRSVLCGHQITIADIAVWSVLFRNKNWSDFSTGAGKEFVNVLRWFNYLQAQPEFSQALGLQQTKAETGAAKLFGLSVGAQGNFLNLDLPGAKMGEVVTRFPPEPSGYMHLGHCKAALLNDYYAKYFKGKLVVRFDDTNPSKEKVEYVDTIMEDIKTLGIKPWKITHTSNYFANLMTYAEKLLKEGKAYIDDSTAEQINEQREKMIESPSRNLPVAKNLQRWKQMKEGTPEGQGYVLRGKIDMKSKNGVLRDPNLYRVVADVPHHRTGSKFKVYPLYDFAAPIVDSIEGVTHALRSNEYHDRNALYEWVLDATEIRKPIIQDFSRLNFTYTLLSKRKLQWFVDKGLVSGWDDPRLPVKVYFAEV